MNLCYYRLNSTHKKLLMKRCLSLFLSFLLLFGIVSCRSGSSGESGDLTGLDAEALETGDLYTAERYELKGEGIHILDAVSDGEGILVLVEDAEGESRYIALDRDFAEIPADREALPGTKAVESAGDALYSLVFENKDGRIGYNLYRDNELYLPLWFRASSERMIVTEAGGVVFAAVSDGSTGCAVCVGTQILSAPDETVDGRTFAAESLLSFGGKTYAVMRAFREEEASYYLAPLEATAESLPEEGTAFPWEVLPALSASGDGTSYFITKDSLLSYDGEKAVEIARLPSLGIDPDKIRSLLALADGRFLLAAEEVLIELAPADKEAKAAESEKQEIVVGYTGDFGPDYYLNDAVTGFNYKNSDYRVILKEYKSESALNLALLSREVDILVDFSTTNLNNYAAKGLLRPLETLCPRLFEEGVLLPNVVKASSIGGACYYLPRFFTVSGCSISTREMNGRTGFASVGEMIDFVRKMDPTVLKSNWRPVMLDQFAFGAGNLWIDWETRTARFDDGEFAKVLAFCRDATDDYEMSLRYAKDTSSGVFCVTFTVVDYYSTMILAADDTEKGRPQETFFPMPVAGHEGACIHPGILLAAVNNGKSADGAAAFLEYTMLDIPWKAGQSAAGTAYYSKLSCVEKNLRKALCLDEPVAKKAKEIAYEIVAGADYYVMLGPVVDIVKEEANRYFAGEITAAQAAEYVQNRVSIYLAEQG